MPLPRVTLLRRRDTHRLVPSRHLPHGDSVLTRIASDERDLAALFDLDIATSDRVLAEHHHLPGIAPHELVVGVPCHAVINAPFCHAHPLGGRFNGPDRGAWYGAFEIRTAHAEVAFHKSLELAEVDCWRTSVTYDDYLADFSASFHDLRADDRFADCLAPGSYIRAQRLAERLLDAGSLGLVYPSVRRRGGTCLACFRPALVANVRKAATWRFSWDGTPKPAVREERAR
jgi:RES domain-containing protein